MDKFQVTLTSQLGALIASFQEHFERPDIRAMFRQYPQELLYITSTLCSLAELVFGLAAYTVGNTVEGTSFSFDEQKRFFTNLLADSKILYIHKCYSIFVYLTGTRRNEALALTTEDVQKILHINGTKTDGSDRYVPLLPLVEKLLKSITPKDGKYFPFSEYVADTTFKKYGAPHKLHDLRHTYGTIQICVNKLDIKTVSLYMGHSTVETTLRIYTHPEQLDRETFLNGSLKEEEKLEILRKEYAEILAIIEDFLK